MNIKEFNFKENLFDKDVVQKMPSSASVYVEEWLVPNYSYVEKDMDVLVLSASDRSTNYASKVVKSPFSGLLVHDQSKLKDPKEKWTMFKVYPNELSLLDDFKYKFDVKKDDFNDSCIVQCKIERSSSLFTGFGLDMTNFNFGLIRPTYFNFEYIGGKFYLIIYYDNKEIKIDRHLDYRTMRRCVIYIAFLI